MGIKIKVHTIIIIIQIQIAKSFIERQHLSAEINLRDHPIRVQQFLSHMLSMGQR